jgi:hypothetical protein
VIGEMTIDLPNGFGAEKGPCLMERQQPWILIFDGVGIETGLENDFPSE